MKKKPYRSLDQVYLSESFAKPVPLLPRQTINEASLLIYNTDHPEGRPFENIDDETAKRIVKMLRRSEKSSSGKSVNQVIQEVLKIDNWDGENVFDRVLKSFDLVKINSSTFENLIQIQTNQKNPLREFIESASSATAQIELVDLIPEGFVNLFENDDLNSALTVLNSIWLITAAEQQANVGPGEIALSIMSDAVKSDTGDLKFNGFGLVDVKGAGARLGGDGRAHTTTKNELEQILQQVSPELSIKGQILLGIKNIIISVIDKIIKKKPDLAKLREFIVTSNDFNQVQQKLIEYKNNLTKEVYNKIEKQIQYYINIHSGEYITPRGKKSIFSPSIEQFFKLTDRLSRDQLVQGFAATRSYGSTDVKAVENAINLLESKDKEIFTNFEKVKKVIAAIHMAEYYLATGINGIIFFSTLGTPVKIEGKKDTTDKRPKKITYLPLKPLDFVQAVFACYNFLIANNAIINLSVESRSKSVGISIQ